MMSASSSGSSKESAFAYTTRGCRVWWSRAPDARETSSPSPLAPAHLRSPFEILLRGIHSLAPREAQWIARAPIIYSAETLSPAEWGLMKVAGKRARLCAQDDLSSILEAHLSDSTQEGAHESREVTWTTLPPPQFSRMSEIGDHIEEAEHLLNIPPAQFQSIPRALNWLKEYARQHNAYGLSSAGGSSTHGSGRRWVGPRRVVGALLLDADARPISWCVNQPEVNRCYHAEWTLLDGLYRNEVSSPSGRPLTLLSTLKPCKMCAGAWVTYGPSDHLNVFYIEDDLGPNGQHTAFDQGSFAHHQAKTLLNDLSISQAQVIL
jgi:tRNA(Arg) A34 adenosine deaminase TadA